MSERKRARVTMRSLKILVALAIVIASPAYGQSPWPQTFAQAPIANSVAVEGGRLSYEVAGSGLRTIIFIHDGFTDMRVWDEIWPVLGHEYRVVRYDRRGHGRTPESSRPYSAVDDIASLVVELGIARAVIVAGSDGADLALGFALAHPAQVEQLVLVSPRVAGGPPSPSTDARISANNAALASGDVATSIGLWVNDRYIVNGPNRSARARLRSILETSPHDLNNRDSQDRARASVLPRLSGVSAPTLILYGARDMPDILPVSRAIQLALPGARLDPVQGSGHLIYLDEPEIFAAAVLAFVRPWTP